MADYVLVDGELYHYGVLGMKWGVRRAKVNAAKARKARSEGNFELATKYESKSKKLTRKHTARSGGRKVIDYTNSQSIGKTVAKSVLFGTHGALRYNEMRSRRVSRGRAAVVGILTGTANVATGNLFSVIEPRYRDQNSFTRKKIDKLVELLEEK